MSAVTKVIPGRTVFLLCDMQERFRAAIHAFDALILTQTKMLKAAKILNVPVIATEQNPRALGPTVAELVDGLKALKPSENGNAGFSASAIHKTLFSMAVPDVLAELEKCNAKSLVIFGIESHVCVLQSTLDFLERGYDVHVLADGVSSCNKEEVPFALSRMRQAGAQITTSESMLFQLQRDSSGANFKQFSSLIKEEKDTTRSAVQALLPRNALL